MKSLLKIALLASACSFIAAPSYAQLSGEGAESLITEGEFYGSLRYRYEGIDQSSIANEAEAHTIQTNVGFKSGKWNDFQGLIEFQQVSQMSDNFNDTVNGNTSYPTVADPKTSEFNEGWVAWSGLPNTTFKVGRQRVNLDNQRFVGTVGWRQNDQTFDSALVKNTSIDNLTLHYGYVWNVNRVFGNDANLGDVSGDNHLAHAHYKADPLLNISAYGYWLDMDRIPTRSLATYGVRFTGKTAISDDWDFSYEAEYAKQNDHGNNTLDVSENYYHIAPAIKGHGFMFKAGYEVLGGDGTNAFQTPLATGHKFNGWADKFLNTPAAGLEDIYATIAYKISGTNSVIDGTKVSATYHDFSADQGGTDFGNEWDIAVKKNFVLGDAGYPFKNVNVLLKYVDFEADDAAYSDTQKFVVQVGTKF